MIAREYPKIETLYDRGPDFNVDTDRLRCPEFGLICQWLVTEKVDGTNVRIALHVDGSVEFGGRTDAAQMPAHLLAYMQATFTPEKMQAAFRREDDGTWPEAIVFGEGYGEKIQNGGKYRRGVAVRIFDVLVGEWWLNWTDIQDVAWTLGIKTVPVLDHCKWLPASEEALSRCLPGSSARSVVAEVEGGIVKPDTEAEGIVARTDPLLFDRRGHRVMWKLKFSDFRKGKKR